MRPQAPTVTPTENPAPCSPNAVHLIRDGTNQFPAHCTVCHVRALLVALWDRLLPPSVSYNLCRNVPIAGSRRFGAVRQLKL